MRTHKRSHRGLAIGVATLAGFVDALGFMLTGGVFVSFMSGNSTRLAVAVGTTAASRSWIALLPAAMIVLFVVGVMLGRVVRHYAIRRPSTTILASMTGLLLLAGLFFQLGTPLTATLILAVAMGAANNIFFRDGEVSIGVTYVTGTLVKLGQRLAGPLFTPAELRLARAGALEIITH